MPDRRFILSSLLGAIVGLGSRAATAHAILSSSTPPIRGTVPAGPLGLRLGFNSRIDAGRSTLLLTRPDRTRTTVPIAPQDAPDVLTARVEVGPGAHVLRWQVLALDGHITRGDLPFTVVDR